MYKMFKSNLLLLWDVIKIKSNLFVVMLRNVKINMYNN